jgi:two-component system, NarL family, nitrate/nitrite response regulator NarL
MEQDGKQDILKGQPLRVMLVEDHEHVLWGLKKLIAGEWPRLVVSASARTVGEARAALQADAHDVVLLDVQLGNDDALEHLPADIAAAGAALVVLTGSGDAQLHRRAADCGALAVVRKDEPAEVLLRQLERARPGRGAAAI